MKIAARFAPLLPALSVLGMAAAPLLSLGGATQDDPIQMEVSDMLRQLYEDDQAVRGSDWSNLTPEEMGEIHLGDVARRKEVLAILADGYVSTADDHFHAAMILQHGDQPSDYLLSHVLATVAGFEGHDTAKWLAAASLDRYLQSVDQPQVFGTQFSMTGSEWTQEPIDGGLFPDALRGQYGVPALGRAEDRLEAMNAR